MQTNDYFTIKIVRLNRMIVYKLLVLDRNTWNHTNVQIISMNWQYLISYNCVQTNDLRQIKVQLKNAMQHWKCGYDCNQAFRKESLWY